MSEKRIKTPTEVVQKAVEEFLFLQKNVNRKVKQSKVAKKFGIHPQTLSKALKNFNEEKTKKKFNISKTKLYELKAIIKDKLEEGEKVTKQDIQRLAHEAVGTKNLHKATLGVFHS